jgi:hypothetical protein
MAASLVKKLQLGACVELSSKQDARPGYPADNFFEDVNDVFSLAACMCIDETTRDLELEYSMMG